MAKVTRELTSEILLECIQKIKAGEITKEEMATEIKEKYGWQLLEEDRIYPVSGKILIDLFETIRNQIDSEQWENEFQGKASYDNAGNGYFYEWINLNTEEGEGPNLIDLFRKYLNIMAAVDEREVKVKVRKGAILIELTGFNILLPNFLIGRKK